MRKKSNSNLGQFVTEVLAIIVLGCMVGLFVISVAIPIDFFGKLKGWW